MDERMKTKYRVFLTILLVLSIIFSFFCFYYYLKIKIPDQIFITAQEEGNFNFNLPVGASISTESQEVTLKAKSNIPADQIQLDLDEGFSLYSEETGIYSLGLKLFGFDLKEIEVNVSEPKYVTPCGIPVGVYLNTNGLMAIGTGKVTDINGNIKDPCSGIVRSGDYIVAVNHEPISTKEEMLDFINENGENPVVLTIRRNEEEMDVKIEPVCTGEGEYKIGLWIRDDTHGIGTLTYVDQEGDFGALGHAISDTDTGKLVSIEDGKLYKANIRSIIKGTKGEPGALAGTIDYSQEAYLGEVTKNTSSGIFGTGQEILEHVAHIEALPVGYSQEVRTGPAQIVCAVSGEPAYYDIEIEKVDSSNKESKSMVLKVTDEELLDLTGGIVQGMSGSPIIQDGKLIGAVTHVFVQDSTKGYGIFIENMLEQ